MTDHSPRRQIAGRALLGAGVLALPLTASMTFAKDTVPTAPEAPMMAQIAGAVPAAPVPPKAPTALAMQGIEKIDPDPDLDEEMKAQTTKIIIMRDDEESEAGEDDKHRTRTQTVRVINRGQSMSEEELEAIISEAKQQLEDAKPAIKNAMIVEEARLQIEMSPGQGQQTIVKVNCTQTDGQQVKVIETDDMVKEVYFCESEIYARALQGLKQARVQIEKNQEIPNRTRKHILKSLDEKIEEWSELET